MEPFKSSDRNLTAENVRGDTRAALKTLRDTLTKNKGLNFIFERDWQIMLGRLLDLTINPYREYRDSFFNALARLTWSIAMEAVAVRKNPETKQLEIFLRRRSEYDTAYPNEWHAPGSVFRPKENERQVADRLKGEFGANITMYKKIANFFNPNEKRGSFLSMVYLVEFSVEQPPRSDERHGWFPVENLPEKVILHHKENIFPPAIKAYLEQNP